MLIRREFDPTDPRQQIVMLATPAVEHTRLLLAIDSQIRDPSEKQEAVKREIFAYLNEKVPHLPSDIMHRDNFDHEAGLFSSELISTPDLEIWACRLNEPDSEIGGRSWILEIALANQAETALFGGRLSCFSRHGAFAFEPATPRLYRRLIEQSLLNGDGIRLSAHPHELHTDDDVEWLTSLVNNPRRWRNVIVFSCNEEGGCVVNPNFFSMRLAGVAHVAKIYPRASFALSAQVTRYLSVFDGGVRVYRPTSSVGNDDPSRHPLMTRARLSSADPRPYESVLLNEAFRESVGRIANKSDVLPSFAKIRAAAAAFRLSASESSGASSEDQLAAALQARQAAEAQASEALDLATQEEQLRQEAQAERDVERARAMALSARVRHLEALVRAQIDSGRADTPSTYEDVPDWVEAQFAGRLRLHARALRGLKNATYEDLECVCDMLQLLANSYVDSKRGEAGAWDAFTGGIRSHGVDLSKSISETRAGEQGKEYFVRWRDRDVLLEFHLKRGASRDPRRDLRIYFFWDGEDEEVVVGWLPSHLDNRLT